MKKIIARLLIAALAVSGIDIGYKFSQADASEKEKSVTVLQADYPKYNTAEELVESSDLVFTGTVKNIESSTIIVKRAGGNFGNDEYVVENASEIAKGKNYLFVTETYENTYPSLLNADQSVYDIDAPQTEMGGKEIMLSDILKIL